MKKQYLAAFVIALVLLLPCTIIYAATRNILFNWTMNDTTGVIGYKMYYSYNENMTITDAIEHSDCTEPSQTPSADNPPDIDFSMTCNNVAIDQYPVYFIIAAVTADKEVGSDIFTITSPLSSVQNFRAISPQGVPSNSVNAVNFQPADASIPSGFQADSGNSFNATLGYGWTQLPASLGTRDRNNSASPDQSYDTLIHVKPEAVWEMAVNSGSYRIEICLGDPSFPGGTPDVQAEGNTIVSGQALSTSNPWIETTADIQVNDGRLSITFVGSTDPARICWIKVNPL